MKLTELCKWFLSQQQPQYLVGAIVCALLVPVAPAFSDTSLPESSTPETPVAEISGFSGIQLPDYLGKEPDKDPWFFQSLVGAASDADFHDAIVGLDFEQSEENSFITAISAGKKVGDNFLVYPFDIFAYVSLQQFNERDQQKDAWGLTVYLKAYHSFNVLFTEFPLRLGFGHGLSYVSRIPAAEARDFDPDPSEKLVYYMDYSLQASVKHIIGRGKEKNLTAQIEDVYVGYSIWHRSSIFGLLGPGTGGLNYLGLSAEMKLR